MTTDFAAEIRNIQSDFHGKVEEVRSMWQGGVFDRFARDYIDVFNQGVDSCLNGPGGLEELLDFIEQKKVEMSQACNC